MTNFKKISIFTILFAFVLSFSVSSSMAQIKKKTQQPEAYKLTGKVVDAETGDALAQVEVTIIGTELEKETGKKGEFTLKQLPEGTHTLKVEEDGYQTWKKKVIVDEDSKLTIKVKPAEE